MKVGKQHYRTIWLDDNDSSLVKIIDQRKLPYTFEIEDIRSSESMAVAIEEMHLRGAGLIGAAGAYGVYLAVLESSEESNFKNSLEEKVSRLLKTRPTAVNLKWAIQRQLDGVTNKDSVAEKIDFARSNAQKIADEDAENCRQIGLHGVKLIQDLHLKNPGRAINILTHCNAGWLAFVDYGSATAPIYEAFAQGIDIHVWVDETRPRNQGAKLTAWELDQHGVPHTVIADNTGGHLMQHGLVDLVITGSDRTTRTGDVANKIGTYLKALAASDNNVPFYVALPSSTFDWEIKDGVNEIPIEERSEEEVKYIDGFSNNEIREVLISNKDSKAKNFGFDVTPSRLVTGLITERGITPAKEESILQLFPERRD